jgi:hypothetical protein
VSSGDHGLRLALEPVLQFRLGVFVTGQAGGNPGRGRLEQDPQQQRGLACPRRGRKQRQPARPERNAGERAEEVIRGGLADRSCKRHGEKYI